MTFKQRCMDIVTNVKMKFVLTSCDKGLRMRRQNVHQPVSNFFSGFLKLILITFIDFN